MVELAMLLKEGTCLKGEVFCVNDRNQSEAMRADEVLFIVTKDHGAYNTILNLVELNCFELLILMGEDLNLSVR